MLRTIYFASFSSFPIFKSPLIQLVAHLLNLTLIDMRMPDKFIVVADDHPAMRSQLCAFVKYHGFTVLFDAADGQDCISQLKSQSILPHLCILDVEMPELDGFLTARRIKDAWPDVRIILYSMIEDKKVVERARECGADAFMGKTWQPDEILKAIRAVLAD